MTNCRIPRVLYRDHDVIDHATAAENLYCLHTVSVTILMNSLFDHMFAIRLSLENALVDFRTFPLEP